MPVERTESPDLWHEKSPGLVSMPSSASFSRTVDSSISSDSCTTATTISSSYSLSSLDTDPEIYPFASDHYYDTNYPFGFQHSLGDPTNKKNKGLQGRPAHQHVYLNMPFQEVKRRPPFYLSRFKAHARRLGRRTRAVLSYELTLWEAVVLLVFAYYLWILLCALAGEERRVVTCGARSSNATDGMNVTPSNMTFMNSTILDEIILPHDDSHSGHKALVEEVVSDEHALSPTRFVRAV